MLFHVSVRNYYKLKNRYGCTSSKQRERENVCVHLRERSDKISKEIILPARNKHRNQRSEG